MEFPLFNTKELSDGKIYNLNDPAQRQEYFHSHAGKQIADIKAFMESNSFVAFLLAKKMAGKGVYSKMFEEVFSEKHLAVISVGDVIRAAHSRLESSVTKDDFISEVSAVYTGTLPVINAIDGLLNRSLSTVSVPTELVLALVHLEINKVKGKSLFIDGFPRTPSQLNNMGNFNLDMSAPTARPLLVLIDIPEAVIDERIKSRRICLICDNPACSGYHKEIMVGKEGDSEGVRFIKDRLDADGELMSKAYDLNLPKVLLRNSVPVEYASSNCEDFELTKINKYSYDPQTGEVIRKADKWVFNDDSGVKSHGLLSAPVTVSMIHQMHRILVG
jgi:adenylate kinase family enzyme